MRIALACVLLVHCGGTAATTPDAAADAGGLALAAEVTIGPFDLAPSEEVTWCITRRLPTTAPIAVGRIESELSPGSHHLVFYRTADMQEAPTPQSCQPSFGIGSSAVPLYAAVSREQRLDFPPGVAYSLAAGQMVRLEAHYINTTSAPISAQGTVRLYATDTPPVAAADLFVWGDAAIDLPAGAMGQVGTFHAFAADTHVFALGTHTHRHGIQTVVELADSATQPVAPLYQNDNWDAPPLLPLAFEVPAGRGLEFSCRYQNTDDHEVRFGESANDEMCFVLGYYYPSRGLDFWLCGLSGGPGC